MVAVYYFRKKTGKQWKVITPEGKERVVIPILVPFEPILW